MVFSSITFLFYFLPIVLVGYFLLFFSRTAQNLWLLFASLFFYAWGEPVFVFVMIASILINWILGIAIEKSDGNVGRKMLWMVLDCVINLGLLGVFKYTGFVVDTINSVVGDTVFENPQISLPIGISFFTFQALSYVVDVYRGDVKAQKNPFYIGLYIAFFPQLVAGPIVRYHSIAEQIENRRENWTDFSEGCCRFVVGLAKKILIANNMAVLADTIFGLVKGGTQVVLVPAMLAWVGVIAYTFQLYFDFSSYSDMASGLGNMFGFQFEENFNYPFISKSVKEFMGRWHISLQTWFSEYVYRPLGGSRTKNQDVMIRNLFIVWLLTGIWHGAAWTFIWWGMYFFVLIVFERLIKFDKWNGPAWFKHCYTIFAVIIAMVIFRAEDMHQFAEMVKNMFALNGNGFYSSTAVRILLEYGAVFIAAILCSLPLKQYTQNWVAKRGRAAKIVGGVGYIVGMAALMLLCIIVLAKGGYNPFIYFNF